MQTSLALRGSGLEVFVAADAIAARSETGDVLGRERLRQAGVELVATDMVAFE